MLVYLDATTIYSIEKVLTILKGAGNFLIYEKLDTDPHRVFIDLAATLGSDTEGKAYLVGAERQTPLAPTVVNATHPPTVVYGIYKVSDPERTGTNFCHQSISASIGTSPSYLVRVSRGLPRTKASRCSLLVANSTGRFSAFWTRPLFSWGGAVSTTGHWMWFPQRLLSDTDYFRSWMVGHKIQIVDADNPSNFQIADIVSVDTERGHSEQLGSVRDRVERRLAAGAGADGRTFHGQDPTGHNRRESDHLPDPGPTPPDGCSNRLQQQFPAHRS